MRRFTELLAHGTIFIVLTVVVKLVLVFGFVAVLNLLSPIPLIGWKMGIMAVIGLLIWFIEFEMSLISEALFELLRRSAKN